MSVDAAVTEGPLTGGGLVLLFLDGVGLGPRDPELNPLVAADTPVIAGLIGGQLHEAAGPITTSDVVFRSLDATMGFDGLPQSATGQTAILTGNNAAAAMSRHYGPWPGPTLRKMLAAGTLFDVGVRVAGAALANAYPAGYFAAQTRRRYRPSAVVFAATESGLGLRVLEDYKSGNAVAADLTGEHFVGLDSEAVRAGPEGSAQALVRVAAENSFTMLDIWLTDHYGHRQDHASGKALIERFDAFLGALVEGPRSLVADGATVLVTSDHGNLEDLSSGSHTRNEVPLLVVGPGAAEFEAAAGLPDIATAATRVIEQRS